jgi:ankyrin repeat protein
VVQLPLENGANINTKWNGATVLHEAALNGREAVVQLLLNKGVDANVKMSKKVAQYGGLAALELAASKSHQTVIGYCSQRLMDGADARHKDGGWRESAGTLWSK